MDLIRAGAAATLKRGREVIAAAGVGAFGLWLLWLGGYLLFPLGLLVTGLALVWAVHARRRLRFAQGIEAPGVVEVDEGQVGYMGPTFGGYVAVPDMVELRVITVQGKRLWRLKQIDGQALLIPVGAAGAERLYDTFATLPGMDTHMLVSAATGGIGDGLVWRRDRETLRLVRN